MCIFLLLYYHQRAFFTSFKCITILLLQLLIIPPPVLAYLRNGYRKVLQILYADWTRRELLKGRETTPRKFHVCLGLTFVNRITQKITDNFSFEIFVRGMHCDEKRWIIFCSDLDPQNFSFFNTAKCPMYKQRNLLPWKIPLLTHSCIPSFLKDI